MSILLMQKVNDSNGLIKLAALVVVLWAIAIGRPFLVPIFMAALLAFLLAPLVRLLERRGVPEAVSIILSTFLLLFPLASGIYLIINQVQLLAHDLPSILRALDSMLANLASSRVAQKLDLAKVLNIPNLTRKFASSAGQSVQLILSGLGALLDAGSQTALVLLFSIVMLASRHHLRQSFDHILSAQTSLQGSSMLDQAATLIERFLIARLLIVLIISAIDTGILVLFGVKYAFLLGSLHGIMTLVPAIGFVLSILPTIVVALATGHSGLETLALSLALLVLSIIEGNVLTPRMVGRQLNINTLFTFLGIFSGGLLWGLWGMFLSIPIVGILRIAFEANPKLKPWSELLADKPQKRTQRIAPKPRPKFRYQPDSDRSREREA